MSVPFLHFEGKGNTNNLQIHCHIIPTWSGVPANDPLQCKGPDVSGEGACGKRKGREKRYMEECCRVVAQIQWRLRQQWDRNSATDFSRSTTLSVRPPLPVAVQFYNMFSNCGFGLGLGHTEPFPKPCMSFSHQPQIGPVLGQSPTWKHSMSRQKPGVEGLVCSAAAWCSNSKVAQWLDRLYLSSTSCMMVVVACSCAGRRFR